MNSQAGMAQGGYSLEHGRYRSASSRGKKARERRASSSSQHIKCSLSGAARSGMFVGISQPKRRKGLQGITAASVSGGQRQSPNPRFVGAGCTLISSQRCQPEGYCIRGMFWKGCRSRCCSGTPEHPRPRWCEKGAVDGVSVQGGNKSPCTLGRCPKHEQNPREDEPRVPGQDPGARGDDARSASLIPDGRCPERGHHRSEGDALKRDPPPPGEDAPSTATITRGAMPWPGKRCP